MKHDHSQLSVRRQCTLLSLTRSSLYFQPVGESAEYLRFMEIALLLCPKSSRSVNTWKPQRRSDHRSHGYCVASEHTLL